jgi:hypothetical protein
MRKAPIAGLLIAAAALLALAFALPYLLLPQQDRAAERRAALRTATRPLDGVRHDDVRWANQEVYDSAYETCGALGVAGVASRFGVTPRAVPAARAFAGGYEQALRPGTYAGCLAALRGQ